MNRLSFVIAFVYLLAASALQEEDPNSLNYQLKVDNVGMSAGIVRNSSVVGSTLGICSYSATCSAGGYEGVCVSVSSGCCSGGTVTSGLCPGNDDIKCCTTPTCNLYIT